jgi:hypothetical protein
MQHYHKEATRKAVWSNRGEMAGDGGGWSERDEATKLVRKQSDDEKS